MTKQASGKKSPATNKLSAKKSTSMPKVMSQTEMNRFSDGDRVMCIVDIDSVKAGTGGTVTQANDISSWVLFDGTSSEMLVSNRSLRPA